MRDAPLKVGMMIDTDIDLVKNRPGLPDPNLGPTLTSFCILTCLGQCSRNSSLRTIRETVPSLKPNSSVEGLGLNRVEQGCAYRRIDATACTGNRQMPRGILLADAAHKPAANAVRRIAFPRCHRKEALLHNSTDSTSCIRRLAVDIRVHGSPAGNWLRSRWLDVCGIGSLVHRCSRRRHVPESEDRTLSPRVIDTCCQPQLQQRRYAET